MNSVELRPQPLSAAQKKVLLVLSRDPNKLPRQIAGFGAAPYLSAARALVRKGLAKSGAQTGYYGITPAGDTYLLLNTNIEAQPRKG
jgi:hypothetical protein